MRYLLSATLTALTVAAGVYAGSATVRAKTVAVYGSRSFLENLTYGADGSLYITSYSDRKILQWSAEKGFTVAASLPVHPIGIACDVDGALYFSAQKDSVLEKDSFAQANEIYTIKPGFPARRILVAKEVGFLNGWCPIGPHRFAIADSSRATLWEFNTQTKRLRPWLRDPLLGPAGKGNTVPAANGVKVNGGWVYVTNTDRNLLVRAKIGTDSRPHAVEVVLKDIPVDDFNFVPDGTLYVATHGDHLLSVAPGGNVTELDTGNVSVRGNTAVVPGRGKAAGSLFVTTDGGLFAQTYLHGPTAEPGRLVQIWPQETSR